MNGIAVAQQWTGPDNPKGVIGRSGSVAIGQNFARGDAKALLELKLPLGDDQLLFSAKSSWRDQTPAVFELDTTRAYVGGARAKASLIPWACLTSLSTEAPSSG